MVIKEIVICCGSIHFHKRSKVQLYKAGSKTANSRQLTRASAVLPHEHRPLVRKSEHDRLSLTEHARYENHGESTEVSSKIGAISIVAG